eukprot:UC1_evm1s1528
MAVEVQAWDRVHRIGQTRPVRIVRLIAEGTIEQRILDIQERKERLMQGSMRRLKPEEVRQFRFQNLKRLLDD